MIVIIMRYKHLKRKGRKSGVRVILIKRERFGNFGNIMLMPSPCKRLETHYRLQETRLYLKTTAPGTVLGLHTEKR